MAMIPDLARIDPAEGPDRIVGQDRQPEKRHGEQDQSRLQLRPSNLFHPAVKVFSKGKQARGGDRGADGNSQIAEQRISAKSKSQHAGDRSGRRDSSDRPVLVASEDRNDRRIGREAKAENDSTDGARGTARCL
jgi:hypothetical protein